MQAIRGILEKDLIVRLINGDQTAFELLFRFYYPGLVVFASQIIADADEAEEIVQDFFVSLWSNRQNIKKSGSLKNYFFISIKNRAFNTLKKNQLKEKTLKELKNLVEVDSLYNPDLFVASELQDKISQAINNLPSRTGEIFQLSRIKGLSNNEIAEQLNLSKRTVETQISNALKILRKELNDYLFILIVLGINVI